MQKYLSDKNFLKGQLVVLINLKDLNGTKKT